ncbi:MAG: RDD family protein [Desulfuromonadales bacterium]|nr:RDD family protein [Desulfuromonadales bacterium]
MQITCPHCNYTKTVDPVRVPQRPVKVSCPQCRQSFAFAGSGAASSPSEPAVPERRAICHSCGTVQTSGRHCSHCGVPLVTTGGQTERAYAGFWLRLVAYLLDSFIIGAVQLILTVALTLTIGALGSLDGQGGATSMIVSLFGVVLGLGYAVFFTGYCGQTPGKMALRIKVIHVDGSPVSYGRAALREIPAKFISGILLGIGYLMIAFDDKKQGLHDRIANTYVIKL